MPEADSLENGAKLTFEVVLNASFSRIMRENDAFQPDVDVELIASERKAVANCLAHVPRY